MLVYVSLLFGPSIISILLIDSFISVVIASKSDFSFVMLGGTFVARSRGTRINVAHNIRLFPCTDHPVRQDDVRSMEPIFTKQIR